MANFTSTSGQIGKKAFKPLLVALAMLVSIAGMAESRRLITGKSILWPPLGTQQNVGNLPVSIILSPSGKYAITTDSGFNETLWSIDASTGMLISHIDYPNDVVSSNGLYYGLAFGTPTTLYVAQGANDTIAIVNVAPNGSLLTTGSIATQAGDFPSGLATDSRGYLYVANNDPATFQTASSVAIYSQSTQSEVGRYSFTSSYFGTPNFPLAIVTMSNGSKTYVTSERDGAVYDLNTTTDPTNPTLTGSIPTGANPNGLLLNKAQTLLYVANGGSDTVSVVNTSNDAIVASVLLRPTQMQNVPGSSTPTGLALSPDGRTLYVSLGDMNAVAMLSTLGPTLTLNGYIPAGWYPSGVVASASGLLVANAKGTTTRYPNPGYIQWDFNSSPYYDLNLIEGNVSFIPSPDPDLAESTKTVVENSGATEAAKNQKNQGLKSLGLQPGSIKHVIYIVKENRTYDQVLGDIPEGDPSLALFGKSVTPNLHALAQRFLLMDNYYVNSEVSFDGWAWSTQAIANEDLIRNVPYNYSGRGRNYDSEGQNKGYLVTGFPATGPDGQQLSFYFPNGAPPIPDVTEGPGGHIWDAVEAAKVTYRNYGFFESTGVKDSQGNVIMPDNYPDVTGNQPPGHDLAGLTDIGFHKFDLSYADSDAPTTYGCPRSTPTYGKYNSPSRYSEWVREFNEMLAQDPTGNSVPKFMTVRFGDDHTQGPTSGEPTPSAEVADNDYGVAQLVQAISHSPIWKSTAIFIVEDDAQDGPDHVDCHRSTAYIISPWIKKNTLDHSFRSTAAMLKTMEMILGANPLSSYDASASPISDWDVSPSNSAPYTATPAAQSIVCSSTPALASLSPTDPRRSMIIEASKMDFTNPDSQPDRKLNELIWKSVKGPNSKMPAPRNAQPSQDHDEDGD